MKSSIEVYVRPGPKGPQLNFHLSPSAGTALKRALAEESFEPRDVRMYMELSVLPDWVAGDQPEAVELLERVGAIHLRFPLTSINIQANQPEEEE